MSKPKALSRFRRQAGSYLKNPGKVQKLIEAVVEYIKVNRGPVKRFLGDLNLLLEMLKAWFTGEYRKVPTRSIVLIIAALIYFISPFDLIPDYLPGGFIDDAAVIGWVVGSISKDISKFRAWKYKSRRK